MEKMATDASMELQLYIPHRADGWFYRQMMSDSATMSYNAAWFPPDGCIPNVESEWERLQSGWIGNEPQRFYAFLQRVIDKAFVGDVNYHHNPEQDLYEMGIVVYAPERGKGYGKQGLHLLLDRAFRIDGIPQLHNEFDNTREAAYHIHIECGFREIRKNNGIVYLELEREEWLSRHLAPDGYESIK